jgi:hypothetical protein
VGLLVSGEKLKQKGAVQFLPAEAQPEDEQIALRLMRLAVEGDESGLEQIVAPLLGDIRLFWDVNAAIKRLCAAACRKAASHAAGIEPSPSIQLTPGGNCGKTSDALQPVSDGGPAPKSKPNSGRGGRKPLEQSKRKSDQLRFQVYERIAREHQPAAEYVKTLQQLKGMDGSKDFEVQVKAAGLELNTKLVRNALAFFDQRKRDAARRNQETDAA